MIKRLLYILLISGLFIQSSCNDVCDCFHGRGREITEERHMETIKGIYLTNNISVVIHPDSNQRMTVTAGENLVDGIETSIENGRLSIRNNNRCNWTREFNPTLQVDIWTNTLQSIYIEDASGDLRFTDTLKVSNFRLDCFSSMGTYRVILLADIATLAIHNGPADIIAEGSVSTQYNYSAGFGKMNCLLLKSNNIYMNNKGTNDNYVYSNTILEAKIEATGNIYYSGNPVNVTTQITGKGKLIKL